MQLTRYSKTSAPCRRKSGPSSVCTPVTFPSGGRGWFRMISSLSSSCGGSGGGGITSMENLYFGRGLLVKTCGTGAPPDSCADKPDAPGVCKEEGSWKWYLIEEKAEVF